MSADTVRKAAWRRALQKREPWNFLGIKAGSIQSQVD
jgi:hypothetical protein